MAAPASGDVAANSLAAAAQPGSPSKYSSGSTRKRMPMPRSETFLERTKADFDPTTPEARAAWERLRVAA